MVDSIVEAAVEAAKDTRIYFNFKYHERLYLIQPFFLPFFLVDLYYYFFLNEFYIRYKRPLHIIRDFIVLPNPKLSTTYFIF